MLENGTIEINVLDMDLFEARSLRARRVAALQTPGGHFNGLAISLRRIQYDWNDPAVLESLLAERRGWIQIGVSEGGLFEYGSDETILRALEHDVPDRTEPETTIVGSLMRDHDSIDPGGAGGPEDHEDQGSDAGDRRSQRHPGLDAMEELERT
ncbi:MAG: hypothetical protein M0C28_32185 [Candidatus Moduliflexus flocculans]|nr:hypothetical protein [Candidatus Moduliflexus flocculans]